MFLSMFGETTRKPDRCICCTPAILPQQHSTTQRPSTRNKKHCLVRLGAHHISDRESLAPDVSVRLASASREPAVTRELNLRHGSRVLLRSLLDSSVSRRDGHETALLFETGTIVEDYRPRCGSFEENLMASPGKRLYFKKVRQLQSRANRGD